MLMNLSDIIFLLPYEPKCYKVKNIMDSGEWIEFMLMHPMILLMRIETLD